MRDVSEAQKITEQVFLKFPSALLGYKGEKLHVLLEKMATELCMIQKPVLRFDDDEEDQAGGLSEKDRVILYLRKQELKWREIASILGITAAAARKRGERALKRLDESM